MSAGSATRSQVVRLARRLEQVERGAALLRRKRESLVAELLRRARPAVDERRAIQRQSMEAWHALLDALGGAGRDELRVLGWPTREVRVDLVPVEAWGLRAAAAGSPPSLVRGLAARGVATGPGDAAPPEAAEQFERLVELLLEAAPKELLMRRLGQALARTTRLVNTLEQRVSVDLRRSLASARRTLEEREREERLRLRRLASARSRPPAVAETDGRA